MGHSLKLTDSMKQNSSQEANNFVASQEISAVYGTGRYIIMVTRAN